MLRAIKELQMFLLEHPKAGQELSNTDLMSYALIKINNTGVMYAKSLERWNAKDITDRKAWATFRQHMIAKFEKLITSSVGPMLG